MFLIECDDGVLDDALAESNLLMDRDGGMTPGLISIWRLNYYEPESEKPYLRKTVLGTAARDAEIARFARHDGGDELRISALLNVRSCPDPFP